MTSSSYTRKVNDWQTSFTYWYSGTSEAIKLNYFILATYTEVATSVKASASETPVGNEAENVLYLCFSL